MLAFLLAACSIGFDVPPGRDVATAWQDDLIGYWTVEVEGEPRKGVAELSKGEDGAYRLDLLGEGFSSVTLRFASHGGRDYAVYDLSSYLEFKPGEPAPDLVSFSGNRSAFGIVLLRRDGDRITAYEMRSEAVKRDLAVGPLAAVPDEGCGPRPVSPELPRRATPEAEGDSGFACLVRIGDEAALGSYLEARGEAIFDLEKPTRLTRLF